MGVFDDVDHNGLIEVFNEGCDSLIENYGVACNLSFPPIVSDCPNCGYNTATKRSNNIYSPGGPRPFTTGICPWCNGVGTVPASSPVEIIKALVYWTAKDWVKIPALADIDWNTPETFCQAWTYASSLQSVLKADKFTLQSKPYEFRRKGEPCPQGLDSRYIVFLLERIKN